mmetsp:Transcript_9737/g.36231  ORF Transcript_9737/g.36231 Transcript_9737/m.36231 type:complete len:457 (-) Transcript_9737:49-1419(-)
MHSFTNIPTDCLQIIFQYHLFEVDEFLVEKLRQGHQDSFDYILVLQRLCLSVSFSSRVDPRRFFDALKWDRRRKKLYHVETRRNYFLTDQNFAFFHGVVSLCIPENDQPLLSDQAFSHLRGGRLRFVDISLCDQHTISSRAFENFRGLHTLKIDGCNQDSIGDEALFNLRGIKKLSLQGVGQLTGDAFANLVGVEDLNISGMHIDDKTFTYLTGVKRLHMRDCTGFTDRAFESLRSCEYLDISGCSSVGALSDAAFINLRRLKTLKMTHITQKGITSKSFENLRNLTDLDMSHSLPMITNDAFKNLRRLTHLQMDALAGQENLTDECFSNLRNLRSLSMCGVKSITGEAFSNLRNLHTLDISSCDQSTIRSVHFRNLANLRTLKMNGCVQVEIGDESFAPLCNLRVLELRHSSPSLTKNCVQYLSHLNTLILSEDCTIPRSAFNEDSVKIENLFRG